MLVKNNNDDEVYYKEVDFTLSHIIDNHNYNML